MMRLPNKKQVVSILLSQVLDELEGMESVAEASRDEATNSETKAEGKYDTRATEASYLARGQAWRIIELRKFATWLSTDQSTCGLTESIVQVGALVCVKGTRTEYLYVSPVGGGKATVDEHVVRAISPSSPLGKAMMELEVGDPFEVDSPRGLRDYIVTDIY